MTQGPADPDESDPTSRRFDAHAEALRPVAGRGRGPTIAAVLIVAAFLVGVLRPWDLLGAGGTDAGPGPSPPTAADGEAPSGGEAAPPTASPSTGPLTADRAAAGVCGYPQGWRSATIQEWAGRRAHVWTAVDVVEATGPTDPTIPYQVVAGEDFTAIGWCAPVEGESRPPLSATGHLFMIDPDGSATELPYSRIDPSIPSALGELWTPADAVGSADPAWPVGRYVIQLGTPSGEWQRWLGLDLRSEPVRPGGSGSASPSASAPPPGSAPPDASSPAEPSPSSAP
jgi:hypothetical protein